MSDTNNNSPRLFASYLLIRNDSGEVLVSSSDLMMPGGSSSDGENALQTVIRCGKEQLGLTLTEANTSVVFAKIVDDYKIIPVYEVHLGSDELAKLMQNAPAGYSWQPSVAVCGGGSFADFHASMFESITKRAAA